MKEGSQSYKGDWGWLMELGRDLLGEGGEGVISMVNGHQILVVLPGFLQVYAPTLKTARSNRPKGGNGRFDRAD